MVRVFASGVCPGGRVFKSQQGHSSDFFIVFGSKLLRNKLSHLFLVNILPTFLQLKSDINMEKKKGYKYFDNTLEHWSQDFKPRKRDETAETALTSGQEVE